MYYNTNNICTYVYHQYIEYGYSTVIHLLHSIGGRGMRVGHYFTTKTY